jgi:hypothetical protein
VPSSRHQSAQGTGSGGDGICSATKALLMKNPPNPRCLAGLQFQCCDYRIILAA